MGYTITPLKLGTIIRKRSNMVYNCGDDTLMDFPLIAFLLEGNGHKILIDTGGSEPDGKKWMPYERKENETLPAALKEQGVNPEEIDAVFFTHLHWDHAGGNESLTKAKFYVQKSEYDFIKEAEHPGFERELVLKNIYELIDGDASNVIDGISVMLTPGHSVGSQSIIVDTSDGKVIIAGDLIPTYYNMKEHIPNGGTYNIDIITKSMEKVLALGLPVLPGHEV